MSSRRSQDRQERLDRAIGLLRYGESVIPVLAEAMADPDPKNRAAILREILKRNRIYAPTVESATQWPPKPALPATDVFVRALRERLSDTEPAVVELACKLFVRLPESARAKAIPRIAKLLMHQDNETRLTAVDTLRKFGAQDRATVQAYVRSLSIQNRDLRNRVGRALLDIGGSAIPVLISALSEENPQAKVGAADALGRFGPMASSAIAPLTALTEDEREEVQGAVKKALARIRGK